MYKFAFAKSEIWRLTHLGREEKVAPKLAFSGGEEGSRAGVLQVMLALLGGSRAGVLQVMLASLAL